MSTLAEDASDPAAASFRRAAAGDAAAFAAFLARYEGRIARTVRALVPREDAEDVFQEVCLRLLAKGHLYDPARPLAPWIDAVARQVCLAARRRSSRRAGLAAPVPLEGEVASAPDRPDDADPWIRDAVQGYLRERPANERRALQLVMVHGLTQGEAAARVGVPRGTVGAWVARGVRALRARLGGRP